MRWAQRNEMRARVGRKRGEERMEIRMEEPERKKRRWQDGKGAYMSEKVDVFASPWVELGLERFLATPK